MSRCAREVYPCTDGQSVYGWAVRARVVAPVRAVEPWLSELSELSDKLSELSDTVGHCRVGTVGQLSDNCRATVGLSDPCRSGKAGVPCRALSGTVGLSELSELSDLSDLSGCRTTVGHCQTYCSVGPGLVGSLLQA